MELSFFFYCRTLWSFFKRSSNRSSRPEMFCKKLFLRNFSKFTGKTCVTFFFIKVAGLRLVTFTLLKRRLAQVFACEFFEMVKNTFLTEHLLCLLLQQGTPIKRDKLYHISASKLFHFTWLNYNSSEENKSAENDEFFASNEFFWRLFFMLTINFYRRTFLPIFFSQTRIFSVF